MNRTEVKILAVLALVQFANIMDFMIMMPLGPFMSKDLGLNASQVGVLIAAYNIAAAASGLLLSRFMDRWDRRQVVLLLLTGLMASTAWCGLGHSFGALLAARITAGAMGGPAGAQVLSIVFDKIPHERRGKAIGLLMVAFSAASVLGLPAGIWLAGLGNWRTPFLALAGAGMTMVAAGYFLLPPMGGHIEKARKHAASGRRVPLWRQVPAMLALALTLFLMVSFFCVLPYLPTYIVQNMGFPASSLGRCYFFGGLGAAVSSQLGGWMVDKVGSRAVFTFTSGCLMLVFGSIFLNPLAGLSGMVILFALVMVTNSTRMMSAMTLFSRSAPMTQRGEFMSVQSSVQNFSAGLGTWLGSLLIFSEANGPIRGAGRLLALSLGSSAVAVALIFLLDARTRSVVESPEMAEALSEII